MTHITWVSQASFTTLFASHVKASARNGKALGPLASTNLWIFVGGIRTDLKHEELGELWFKIKHTSFNLNFQTDIIGCHLGDLSFEAYKTFHVNVNYAGFLISFFGGSLTRFPDVLLLSEYGGRTSGRAGGMREAAKLRLHHWVFSCDLVDEVFKLLWRYKFRHVFAPWFHQSTCWEANPDQSSRVLLYGASTLKHT